MPSSQNYLLSVIVPVFNEELLLKECVRRMQAVMQEMGCRHELLFVNDGSTDSSLSILLEEKKKDPNIKILNFSRNFGHQLAITAGMDHAKGDAVVVIDADLQDPPHLIRRMVTRWQKGYDIVYARRLRRMGETIFKKWTAAFFYRLIRKISKVDIPVDVGDFRLLSRRALDSLNQIRETHRYVRGLVAWLGYRHTFVDYVRKKRFAGETKYPISKMLRFSLDGLTAFSILPLRFASYLGFTCALLAFLYLPYALCAKFILKTAVLGWTTVIMAVFFLGGIQLICIGIMGEYIGILHDEAKRRPLYIVSDIY